MRRRLLTGALYALSLTVGVVALAYPFLVRAAGGATSPGQTSLLSVVLVTLCLAVLLVELQGQATGAKTVAALGILVAATATLRFIEVAIPAPGGFSPVFAPIILGGYVFGARFGFLLGAMTMLVSGIITAGVGRGCPIRCSLPGGSGLARACCPICAGRGRNWPC
jgi:energy-coupling factor transport system substrate-specific component